MECATAKALPVALRPDAAARTAAVLKVVSYAEVRPVINVRFDVRIIRCCIGWLTGRSMKKFSTVGYSRHGEFA
jgi:hypothetical protein